MLTYPLKPTKDSNDTILVDFPEAHTFGDDREEVLLRAADALEALISGYMDLRRDIPPPSKVRREQDSASVSPLAEAKVRLYFAMRAAKVGKAELAGD